MNDIRYGDLVVTSTQDDAQVYMVQYTDGYTITLVYRGRERWYAAGKCDRSIIKQPSRAQLENCVRQLIGDTP